MAALTEAQLSLQKSQQEAASPAQALVNEELLKRLEVLEAERCQLATSLSERQQEVAMVSELLYLQRYELFIFFLKNYLNL